MPVRRGFEMSLSTTNYVVQGAVRTLNGHTINAGYTVNQDMLGRFVTVLDTAVDADRRVFAFRVDLRFPAEMILTPEIEKRLIDRFVASFKAKIRHNRSMALKVNPNAHDTEVRFSWVREVGADGSFHYHFIFYLNRDAFNTLGSFRATSGNLYTRLVEAWASALGLKAAEAVGLVHVTENAMFNLNANSTNYGEVRGCLVHNLSYLAKDETKVSGDGRHRYGCSRK